MYKEAEDTVTISVAPVPLNPTLLVQVARDRFNEGRTKPIKFRRKQLQNFLKFLKDNEKALVNALYQDLRKPKLEALVQEIDFVANDLQYCLNHLDEWAKPKSAKKPLVNFLDDTVIYKDPYGVALVIGSWNYPVQVLLLPLVGAIAAGNCVVLKPSEFSPSTSQLIHDLLPKYLDKECYPVYLGGVEETTLLLKERFDYIFFTGSTATGRIIHQAAAKNLTPTTLELGGKSPVYIDSSADLDKTVKRVMWGKCTNAGQVCVGPDYILCTKEIQEKFVKYALKTLVEFFGGDVKESPDFGRIITDRHFNRLVGLMSGLKIALGGNHEAKDRYMEPTIAVDVSPNHPVMQEEIFGPILPIVPVSGAEEAITFINKRDKPLALYVFSKNKDVQEMFLNQTSSGGVCINDTVIQLSVNTLPFGGVGASGIGKYHGRTSFETFVHEKSVLVRGFSEMGEKATAARYPPYSDSKLSFLRLALAERKGLSLVYLPHFVMFLLGVGVAGVVYFICQYYVNKG